MKTKKLFFVLWLLVFQTIQAQWSQQAKFLPARYYNSAMNEFGYSVDMDGEYAVVGSAGYDSSRGIAYVLHYNGNTWITIATLTASDGKTNDHFGCAVGISGDVIVVGANGFLDNYDLEVGKAYIFKKPDSGWTDMTESAEISPSDPEDNKYFGCSVDVSGDVIVVGADEDNNNVLLSGAAYVYVKPAMGWKDTKETAKLTASDEGKGYYFGNSVSISGDVIVVGAYKSKINDVSCGAAYVFEKPDKGWQNMTETGKLRASDHAFNDYFGYDVSIDGDNIAIGSKWSDIGDQKDAGAVYVFTKPLKGWSNQTETAKLTISGTQTAYNNLGRSVSINGRNIVAGGAYNSSYVYVKPSLGWSNMTETAVLSKSNDKLYDKFGFSLGISGDNVLIGAYSNNTEATLSGALYYYKRPGTGWADKTEDQILYSPTQTFNSVKEEFGNSVDIDGNYGVIGAPGYKSSQGRAYVIKYDGSAWDTVAILTASDGVNGDNFGASVGISGDNIVIGAASKDSDTGAAYVYTKPSGGWSNMTETAKLTASSTSHARFGGNVKISGDNIVVGASHDNTKGYESGAAYVFTKPLTGWTNMTETAKLTASDGDGGDYFGSSLDISGDNIVVGAYNNSYYGYEHAGSAYVFTKPDDGWKDMEETAILTISDPQSYKCLGLNISISGKTIAVSSYDLYQMTSENGTVYVYTEPNGGWKTANETAKLTCSDNNYGAYFGYTVSVSENKIVAGTKYGGMTFVYEEPSGGWADATETSKFSIADIVTEYSENQSKISISGDNILIGAPHNMEYGITSGCAFIFSKSNATNIKSENEAKITLSPNPTYGPVVIRGVDHLTGLSVCDVTGREILTTKKYQFDLSGFKPGIYFIRIDTGKDILIRKIIKK